jgi:hypothetical protein
MTKINDDPGTFPMLASNTPDERLSVVSVVRSFLESPD